MQAGPFIILGASMVASVLGFGVQADDTQGRYMRVAEIEIDPALLEKYNAAAKEEIEASVRVEAGVLALYAVSEKDNPSRIRILEIYADEAAYQAHIGTPHFKKYKTETQEMVKSLKLFDVEPIALSAKPN